MLVSLATLAILKIPSLACAVSAQLGVSQVGERVRHAQIVRQANLRSSHWERLLALLVARATSARLANFRARSVPSRHSQMCRAVHHALRAHQASTKMRQERLSASSERSCWACMARSLRFPLHFWLQLSQRIWTSAKTFTLSPET